MQQQDTSYRHKVTIHPADDSLLIECQWCGALGVSVTDEAADLAKSMHETFGGVLRDALEGGDQ